MNKENKKYIIETVFLKESLKHNLTLNEFLILMYFDNEYDVIFDVKKVARAISLSEKEVLNAFGSLLDKKLITLISVKNENGKLMDKVSLDNLYNGIKDNEKNKEKDNKKQDLFSKFQEGYGHSLSGTDYELINGWLQDGFTDELILGALNEANYNGKTSLRYIDRILYEWKKKGFKKMADVNNHMITRNTTSEEEQPKYETQIWEYNWLDEE